ncbi:Crp/Fnr family transcriptional regulator [Limnoraphis robusta Tam1]|jgi:CRP-like cAMP-binding protein|uniref:Crp/Fnr family transcriptional regulator n=1 Tax=Limnoraphis robusta CCNP1315 TaxID=3110306 RepID=A0ABU5U3Z6_9CYAN|nr:helix-turn-helix domain-containing protein [Limnoraphis robusta]MEA5497169.1 Crp/Fnr family transcriptional regulator [Limnoraphis robusta BA-68 BA1]MEA5521785.1 Crp/Fnr family transcriptional regulator [Limnoraphis robusta CCNP1315]MEA5537692.1 Crp/Fnr family transcriptional regulator [Limnoraphis robusta Tam1]MEA5546119.1 Crp/Fnr family transcriptional regulator [Limnoraphis robusta CCNP1324]
MQSTPVSSETTNRPFLTWQRIIDWAQEHYRCRNFNKDERIPARPGLLYLVQRGSVRLVGSAQLGTSAHQSEAKVSRRALDEAFLGFVGAGQPFELVAQSPFSLQAYAHTDDTNVLWMYWEDLDNWPHFRREVLDAFRYQHQRKLLWLSTLGQRRTIDRLLGFLTLLIEEYGEYYVSESEEHSFRGYCLPWPLTHSQIGSAIGSTRVTVTRLMGKLRTSGLIYTQDDNLICLPAPSEKEQSV